MNAIIEYVVDGLKCSRESAVKLVFFFVGWLTAWALAFLLMAIFR